MKNYNLKLLNKKLNTKLKTFNLLKKNKAD